MPPRKKQKTSLPRAISASPDFDDEDEDSPVSSFADEADAEAPVTTSRKATKGKGKATPKAKSKFQSKPQTKVPPAASTSMSSGRKGRRRSKLAKENDITAEQEESVQEVWAMFRRDDVDADVGEDVGEDVDEKGESGDGGMGVIRTGDVERCLRALSLAPSSPLELSEFLEILDPSSSGFVTYPHFLSIAALQFSQQQSNNAQNYEERVNEEVTAAMRLFTNGVDRDVTIDDLRRVRGVLKEDGVGEDVLRAMVGEANRDDGGKGKGKGGDWKVGRKGFEGVMRRCGLLK